jgi:hypothetical protein
MSPETEIKRERERERERAFQSLFKEKESWMPKAERWISEFHNKEQSRKELTVGGGPL